MEARKVDLDFSDAKVFWNPAEPEYCQMLNAISSQLPYLEALLIKAVRGAAPLLPPERAEELRPDIELFLAQEGRHSRLQKRFHDLLAKEGYDFLPPMVERIRGDFRFFAEKGLKFTLAYCEGFETFGPLVSRFFFEEAGVLMADWDEPTTYLWLWHFAEEYEHRTVCNRVFDAVYGDYWYRLYGLTYATVHLFTYSVGLALKMLSADRRAGRIPDCFRSRVRFVVLLGRFARFMIPKVIFGCMRRSYDPAAIPPPRHCVAFLEAASQRYGVVP
jgi:predicted metal-dependent hydrolase